MVADLLNYISLIWSSWWSIMTLTLPTIISITLNRLPWLNRFFSETAPLKRTLIEVIFPITGVMIAGFWVWQDENRQKLAFERSVSELKFRLDSTDSILSRLEVVSIEPILIDNKYTYRYYVKNSGTVSAQLIVNCSRMLVSEVPPNDKVGADIMKDLEKCVISNRPPPGKEIEVRPGTSYYYDLKPTMDNGNEASHINVYNAIIAGSQYLYVYVVAMYNEESLSKTSKFRMLKYCASYTKVFNFYRLCPGENRTITINQ